MGLYNLIEAEQSPLAQKRADQVAAYRDKSVGDISVRSNGNGSYTTSLSGRTQGRQSLLGTPNITIPSSTTTPKVSLPSTSSSSSTSTPTPAPSVPLPATKTASPPKPVASSTSTSGVRPGIRERVSNILGRPLPPSSYTNNPNGPRPGIKERVRNIMNPPNPPSQNSTSNDSQYKFTAPTANDLVRKMTPSYPRVTLGTTPTVNTNPAPAKSGPSDEEKQWIQKYKAVADEWRSGAGGPGVSKAKYFNMKGMPLAKDASNGYDKDGNYKELVDYRGMPSTDFGEGKGRGKRRATNASFDRYNNNLLSLREQISTKGHGKMGLFRLNESDNWRCTTPGISLSPVAKRKMSNMGRNNHNDMNFGDPNGYYDNNYDRYFLGDGDDPETSKTNIPAILAAKTAGGSPWPHTINNNISNKIGSDVFKLGKLRDDEYTPY